jgi:hypothetical protein
MAYDFGECEKVVSMVITNKDACSSNVITECLFVSPGRFVKFIRENNRPVQLVVDTSCIEFLELLCFIGYVSAVGSVLTVVSLKQV